MTPPFSPERKNHALQRLAANYGNVARTAAETGISERTLMRWRRQNPPPPPPPTQLITPPSLPADDLEALINLKGRLIEAADYISFNIIPAVEAAPLGQRVSALAQLIDRISKLAAELPVEDEEMELSDDVEEVDDEEDA